ncbi:MAG: hypothetical protein DDT40_00547 [candidate division WS2 bacterium]|uniref:Uncharacterized protein n=1 Tax=Psychracetigena formicireducens TaxID=2986056 RepID=A0A9E2BFU4_PSYF1|nr:hypothetical protein [Candidatus Psychracetigena formicireducens]MBT9144830.1 hypothetical protein [Candidatus Psychracetigena formicireducens]MBT9150375.1 hypothetical protein [Candidatus Psychracetigena formicireducens]
MYIFLLPLLLLLIILPLLFIFYLVPLTYAFQSIVAVFTVPKQIYELFKKPLLRKNHAIEHATINVLEKHLASKAVFSGYAREDGFIIQGPVDILTLEVAARNALDRLKAGEKELAIHSSCGTGKAVGSFISGVIILGIFLFAGYFNIWTIILSFLISTFVGPIVGEMVQKIFTTIPEVKDMFIGSVENDVETSSMWFSSRIPMLTNRLLVKTRKYYEIVS